MTLPNLRQLHGRALDTFLAPFGVQRASMESDECFRWRFVVVVYKDLMGQPPEPPSDGSPPG